MTMSYKQISLTVFRIILLLPLLATPTFSTLPQGFNYDSYQPTSLDTILENPPPIKQGMDIFFKKRQFSVTLKQYPQPCPGDIIGKVLHMRGITEVPEVSYCMQVTSVKGKSVQVYIQDVLVDALKEEVKEGGAVRLYAAYLYYDATSKEHGILVNEFEAEKRPEPRKKN